MKLAHGQAGRAREVTMKIRLSLGVVASAFLVIIGAPAAVASDCCQRHNLQRDD